MVPARPLMFHKLAAYYDLQVAAKDYRSEVGQLERLVRRYGRSGGKAWLDVACGTGRHLEILRRTHPVVGVDISAEMLRVARRRLPGVRLVRSDMRTFRLEETFDVVSCLYSAIGHLKTERDLLATFSNFARHLRPGGIAIVEPWIAPADFRPRHLDLLTTRSPTQAIVRLAFSTRRGRHSLVHYHFLIGEIGRGIEHFEETDVGLLVAPRRLVSIMRSAGLEARFVERGLTFRRGLLLGVKNSRSSSRH